MSSNLILYICPLEDQAHLIIGTCNDPNQILSLNSFFKVDFYKSLMITAEKSFIKFMESSLLCATACDEIEACSFTSFPKSISVKINFTFIHALPIIEKIVRHFHEKYPDELILFKMTDCNLDRLFWKAEIATIDSFPWSSGLGDPIIKIFEYQTTEGRSSL